MSMTVQTQHVLAEAMELPPEERALVAEEILASLTPHPSQAIDEMWAIEAERRIDAFDRGEVEAIPAEDVFAKINRQRRK